MVIVMPPTKPAQTVDAEHRRIKAFELYMDTLPDGSRRSLRSIALTCGVSIGAVRYWLKYDDWDGRINDTLNARRRIEEISGDSIRSVLKDGVMRHLKKLDGIIGRNASDKTTIIAIHEYVDIAKKLDALGPDTAGPSAAHTPTIKDDLPHGDTGRAGSEPGDRDGHAPEDRTGHSDLASRDQSAGVPGLPGESADMAEHLDRADAVID